MSEPINLVALRMMLSPVPSDDDPDPIYYEELAETVLEAPTIWLAPDMGAAALLRFVDGLAEGLYAFVLVEGNDE